MKSNPIEKERKNRYYKIQPHDGGGYWVTDGSELSLEIEDWLDNNDGKLTVSIIEMTKEEFNNLPEYEG